MAKTLSDAGPAVQVRMPDAPLLASGVVAFSGMASVFKPEFLVRCHPGLVDSAIRRQEELQRLLIRDAAIARGAMPDRLVHPSSRAGRARRGKRWWRVWS